MEAIIIKYKVLLSVLSGTFFLVAANYAPALSLFLLTDKDVKYETINWIFLFLGVIFLWGRIVLLARIFTNFVGNRLNKKQ